MSESDDDFQWPKPKDIAKDQAKFIEAKKFGLIIDDGLWANQAGTI